MMRIDFPQGVPDGCIIWLREHVGIGMNVNFNEKSMSFNECDWFYERRFEPYNAADNDNLSWGQGSYIPSITIKDGKSKEALLFALTWSGQ